MEAAAASSAATQRDAGVDGVLVVDYPPEECDEFAAALKTQRHRPDLPARADLDRRAHRGRSRRVASGYVYYVSLKGVTGAGAPRHRRRSRGMLPRSARTCKLPVGVGFGIRDARDARRRVGAVADAVVIGSRIIQGIENAGRAAVTRSRIRRGSHALDIAAGAGSVRDDESARCAPTRPKTKEPPMSWLEKLLPPKIQRTDRASAAAMPEGLWIKCPSCEAVLYSTDLEKNLQRLPEVRPPHAHRRARAARRACSTPKAATRSAQEVAAGRHAEVQGQQEVPRSPEGGAGEHRRDRRAGRHAAARS